MKNILLIAVCSAVLFVMARGYLIERDFQRIQIELTDLQEIVRKNHFRRSWYYFIVRSYSHYYRDNEEVVNALKQKRFTAGEFIQFTRNQNLLNPDEVDFVHAAALGDNFVAEVNADSENLPGSELALGIIQSK